MQRSDFQYLIKNKVLVISGSLSSEIERRLKVPTPFTPRFILDKGDLVLEIQKDFARAGAQILVTGTSKANSEILASKAMTGQMEEVNRKAVKLCQRAVLPDGLIFGGLGSTGALLKPYGRLSESDYRQIFQAQAKSLLDAGVDGFLLQGFSSLIEAEQCILGLQEICSVPIIATMTILEDGVTKFGDSVVDCFRGLRAAGADSVGIHGTLGPLEIEGFLETLKERYPLCVRPNAGYPVRIGNTHTYLSSPDYVAEFAEVYWKQGAVIIGGAAGFTHNHIEAVAKRLHGKLPHEPEVLVQKDPQTVTAVTKESEPMDKKAGPTLRDKLGNASIMSVELEPPHGLAVEHILALLAKLQPFGIDAVNIPENPLARARISAIALAKLIHERTGLESIAHLTCRDRNLISLQAELLGAHILGIHNILALTGDPSGVGDFPSATSNFDVDSLGLVEIMNRMNIGNDFGMNDLGAHTCFNIGVAANPLATDLGAEMNRLEAKIKRGATFIQTQPVFDPARVEPFLKRVEAYRIPVLFGVMLIRDYRNAKFLINEYPGIHIHDDHMERFRTTSEADQEKLGVAIACEMVRDLRPMSGGVYLMTSFGDEARLLDVFQRLAET